MYLYFLNIFMLYIIQTFFLKFQFVPINVQIVFDYIHIVEDWQDILSMNVESNGSFHVLCAIDRSNVKSTFVDI